MSQPTTVRTASRTDPGIRWWHLSCPTGSFDVADGVVEQLVTPLVAHARLYGVRRWYFTRSDPFSGAVGVIRLSIHAHPRVLDRLRSDRRVLEEEELVMHRQVTLTVHQARRRRCSSSSSSSSK